MLLDNIVFTADFHPEVIEQPIGSAHRRGMIRIARILVAAVGALFFTGAAQAACEVEYKAKRDNPLELYYDVTTVNAPCASAEAALRATLAARGLVLLKILSRRET